MRALRHLAGLAVLLVILGAIGVVGYHFIEGWPWFDGLYMVLTTFTTIGYQEVHPLSHAGRIFNLFLIVCGVSLLFLMIGTLTQALLEFELRDFFGRRKMERDIDRLEGHYIICGAGRVGRSVARELSRKPVPFVVIDTNEPKMSKFAQENWLTILGDATQEHILRKAHIERAVGLVAATTTDAVNIYIVLNARAMNPKLKVIARASEEDAEKHLKTAGADVVVSPYHFAGHRIAQAFLRPHVLDFLDSATVDIGTDLEIAQVGISEGSHYAGRTIGESNIRSDTGLIVLAIKRNGEMRTATRDEKMLARDVLIVMGDRSGLKRLEELAEPRVIRQ